MENSCSIDKVIEYAICPARAFISSTVEQRPAMLIIRERLRPALNDLTLRSLDKGRVDEKSIGRVVDKVFENLSYEAIDKDIGEVTNNLLNLNGLLGTHEMTITGSVVPFELSYGGVILKSAIDMTVKDHKRGYIYPVVVDFSRTRYDPMYNPIAYRCHTVAKEMGIRGTNTEIHVFTLSSGKQWVYEHNKYQDILEASIGELLQSMVDDRWPVRFGWWCAACIWRGLCFKILKK